MNHESQHLHTPTSRRRAAGSAGGQVAAMDPGLQSLAEEAYRRLHHRAQRCRLPRVDADDVLQRCAEKLWTRLTVLAPRYPTATALADALWRSAIPDHFRVGRIQRGEGARTTGQRRRVMSFDTWGPDWSEFHVSVHVWDTAFERVDDADELVRSIPPLPLLARRLLWLVRVEGRTVSEAAAILGCSREHASRQLSAAGTIRHRGA